VPCREHLVQVRKRWAEFQELGAAVAAVSFEQPEQVRGFARVMGLPFPILSDPDRAGYAAFGLTAGERGKVWSRQTAGAYLRGLAHGRLPHMPKGDTAQLGGDVVLDAVGDITYVYRSDTPADRPSIDELLDAVRLALADT
jgi:hypothetical protein